MREAARKIHILFISIFTNYINQPIALVFHIHASTEGKGKFIYKFFTFVSLNKMCIFIVYTDTKFNADIICMFISYVKYVEIK